MHCAMSRSRRRSLPLRPLCLALAFAAWVQASAPSRGSGLFDLTGITDMRLDNGLHVIVCPDDAADVVAVNVIVRAGAANEWGRAGRRESRISWSTCSSRARPPAGGRDRAGDRVPGRHHQRGHAARFHAVYVVVASPFFAPALDALADAVLHPAFPGRGDGARARRHPVRDRAGSTTCPMRCCGAAPSPAFPATPTARPSREASTTSAPSRATTWCASTDTGTCPATWPWWWWATWRPRTAFKEIKRAFGGRRRRATPRRCGFPEQPEQREVRTAVEERATDDAYVLMAFRAPG